ncbi:MAG: hypothetical protein FWB74_08655 [Defluviitaleaceae bacterium]|nr:hypothetical protein [Defluviitaleaceae bacterium]
MKRKFLSFLMAALMVFGIIVPASAAGLYDDKIHYIPEQEIADIFSYDNIVYYFTAQPLPDEVIEAIIDIVVSSGNASIARLGLPSNVQVEFLGDVDEMYDVVEITEVISRTTTKSGEVFEQVISTRSGGIYERTHFTPDGAFRIVGRMWTDRAMVRGFDYVRLTRFRLESWTLNNNFSRLGKQGHVGQQSTEGLTPCLNFVINAIGPEFLHFDTHRWGPDIAVVEGTTGFTNFMLVQSSVLGFAVWIDAHVVYWSNIAQRGSYFHFVFRVVS